MLPCFDATKRASVGGIVTVVIVITVAAMIYYCIYYYCHTLFLIRCSITFIRKSLMQLVSFDVRYWLDFMHLQCDFLIAWNNQHVVILFLFLKISTFCCIAN